MARMVRGRCLQIWDGLFELEFLNHFVPYLSYGELIWHSFGLSCWGQRKARCYTHFIYTLLVNLLKFCVLVHCFCDGGPMSVWLQDLSATAVGSLSRFLCLLLERLPSMQGYRASLFGTNFSLYGHQFSCRHSAGQGWFSVWGRLWNKNMRV